MYIIRKKITAPLLLGFLLLTSPAGSNAQNARVPGKCIANPITYEVIVNNPDPEDEWKTECLANTQTRDLVHDIFAAVKTDRLKAHDYYDNHVLSMEEIAYFEKEEEIKERIGSIQFIEKWYWDKQTLQFHKKVEGIMLGYENYDDEGNVKSYKASFVVYFNR